MNFYKLILKYIDFVHSKYKIKYKKFAQTIDGKKSFTLKMH